jgi:galactitol-specific phosphotransferase system IIC component
VRGLVNAVVILCGILWIGTSLAELTTQLARAAHFAPEGLGAEAGRYSQWSGVALGSHVVPWIVLQLFRRETFLLGAIAALLYGGVWWWVRGEVRARYPKDGSGSQGRGP